MNIDPSWLEILACPVCRGSLRWEDEGEKLICDACAKAYPLRDGIPDLLPESGRDIDEES